MAIIRINELPEGSGSLTSDDALVFMDNPSSSGITKKISLSELASVIGASGGNPFDQDLNTTDNPTFVGVNLSNGTTLAQGTYDNGTGGNNGISLNCYVGYELNWQGGHLKSTSDNGNNTANILFDSPIEFPGSGIDNLQIDNEQITFNDGTTQNTAASGLIDTAFNAALVAGEGISLDYAGGTLTINSSGGSGFADTNTYVFCKTGDNIASRYAAAKLLNPGGNPLSATNRATLIIMPGNYSISSQLNIDAEFVDILGLGSTKLDRGCACAVKITGNNIDVSANDVKIKGIQTSSNRAITITGEKPLQIFEDCISGVYIENPESDPLYDGGFGSYGYAAGTFVNCVGDDYSFGYFGITSGSFTNCVGGDYSFGGEGTASGSFQGCVGGDYSFGYFGITSGSFTNCVGGDYSFGGTGTASGSFQGCVGGDYSFGIYGTASGSFQDCVGGYYSFGGGGAANGSFQDCVGGDHSFGGGGGTASGSFINCIGEDDAFGGGYFGNSSGTFRNCIGKLSSFGGDGGNVSGYFIDCTAGEYSFGFTANVENAFLLKCVLTVGNFPTPGTGSKYRLCIDGGYNIVSLDG